MHPFWKPELKRGRGGWPGQRDYAALEAAMAHCDAVIPSTRQTLDLQSKGSASSPVHAAVQGEQC